MTVVRTTLAEQVASALIEQIEKDGLGPGDAIPSEAALAETFGVNRLVVREAIRMLSTREFLISTQGRPAQVSTPSARVLAQMVDFRIRQHSLRVEDVLDTRRVVEAELARLAARRVGTAVHQIEVASELLQRMADAVEDRDSFVELDMRFHSAIAEAAGAPLLELILASLESVMTRARRTTFEMRERRGEGHQSTLTAHRTILKAISAGDEGAAVDAMIAHIDDTRRDVGPDVSG